jgi:hypothetical protein
MIRDANYPPWCCGREMVLRYVLVQCLTCPQGQFYRLYWLCLVCGATLPYPKIGPGPVMSV